MTSLNPYASFLHDSSLHDREPLSVLADTPARLQFLADAIGPDRILRAPAPGKWSASHILCHLADCEIAFAFRLRQTLAETAHTIQPFDQDQWSAAYAGLSAADALAAFTALRRWNLALIGASLPSHAAKPVTHPERGVMTFSTIVETMAGHDLNHLTQLERILAA